jgi:hypothetical protein
VADNVSWETLKEFPTLPDALREVERLRVIIKQAAKLVENYGDGAVIYPDEQAVIDMLQEESRRED